jgi:multiple sugar transport system substrate-binding protein
MKASQLTRREMLKILAASAAGAAGTFVAGCAPQPTPAAAPASPVAALFDYKRFKGQSIFVSLSKNPVADLIAANIAEFKELTGITAEVEVIPEQQQRQINVIKMSAKSSQIDVWQSGYGVEMRMFGKAGWYQPINAYLKDPTLTFPDLNPDDIGKGAWDLVTEPNGSIDGLPLQLPAIMLAYRKDLVDAKGLKLDTLDDLEAAVKALHNPPAVYGFVGRGLKNANMAPLSTLIPNFGGSYLDKNRKLTMTSPEVIKAVEYYVRLMRYAPPGVIGYNWYESQAVFIAGQAAFWIDGADLLAVADDSTKSKIAGKVGYMIVPKGPGGQFAPAGSNVMAINPFSTKKEAAYYFIQWAVSKKMQVRQLLVGTPAVRSSAWQDPEFLSKTTLPKGWIDVVSQVPNKVTNMMPDIVPVTEFRDNFGVALTKAIEGGDVAQLFKAAQAEFEPIYAKSEE